MTRVGQGSGISPTGTSISDGPRRFNAAAIDGVEQAHVRARWTGRTLRLEIEGCVNPTLAVRDADHLRHRVVDAVLAAIPEARVVTFTARAMPFSS